VSSSSTIDDSAHPYLRLTFSGVRDRRAQADGDVAGEVIATNRDDCRVPEMTTLVDRDVDRAAADIDQRDAELLLIGRQRRLGASELLDDRVDHLAHRRG
jgi:hypothetical protein